MRRVRPVLGVKAADKAHWDPAQLVFGALELRIGVTMVLSRIGAMMECWVAVTIHPPVILNRCTW